VVLWRIIASPLSLELPYSLPLSMPLLSLLSFSFSFSFSLPLLSRTSASSSRGGMARRALRSSTMVRVLKNPTPLTGDRSGGGSGDGVVGCSG
jgi:hypothetical protein